MLSMMSFNISTLRHNTTVFQNTRDKDKTLKSFREKIDFIQRTRIRIALKLYTTTTTTTTEKLENHKAKLKISKEI